MPPSKTTWNRTHEAIIAAATRLFYTRGVGATSMHNICEAAGVAVHTLYAHFRGGKNELLVETVTRAGAAELDRLAAAIGAHPDDAPAQLAALLDALEAWTSEAGFQGSFVANTGVELHGQPDHPVHRVIGGHRGALQELFEALARRLGGEDPSGRAEQVSIIVDGALNVAARERTAQPVRRIRPVLEALLARSTPTP